MSKTPEEYYRIRKVGKQWKHAGVFTFLYATTDPTKKKMTRRTIHIVYPKGKYSKAQITRRIALMHIITAKWTPKPSNVGNVYSDFSSLIREGHYYRYTKLGMMKIITLRRKRGVWDEHKGRVFMKVVSPTIHKRKPQRKW